MSDTVKAAVIIGVCLMLGLWGNGWLSKSDVGGYSYTDGGAVFDSATGSLHGRVFTKYVDPPGLRTDKRP